MSFLLFVSSLLWRISMMMLVANYMNLFAAAIHGEYDTCMLYADQLKQRCVEQFKDGNLDIEQLDAVDAIYLTYDCDGKIDRFIGGESSLPLHELGSNDGPNYLGIFLGGAYEEALGVLHNLFGRPSILRVSQSDSPYRFTVTCVLPGPSCADVLWVMHHEPKFMFGTLRHFTEEFVLKEEQE
ncbi:TCP transcription factor 10 [Capsicum annuum]|nr:TCP transcription factor 10 [Capsicum annuum]KAF3678486.1 TCP transcription factor 10 [Capsicum annuum]